MMLSLCKHIVIWPSSMCGVDWPLSLPPDCCCGATMMMVIQSKSPRPETIIRGLMEII